MRLRPEARNDPSRRWLAFGAVLVVAACSPSSADEVDGWTVERTNVDGVEVVRTLDGSVWRGPAELVEELVIGVLEGEDEYMFGRIGPIAPDGEGGVYVFDGQVPALRHYDAGGRYTRTLGGQGQGPGEYLDTALGLAVLPDGRILLRDPRNARFNLYDPDGTTADHWPLASSLFTGRATYVDTAGYIYARILTGVVEPDRMWPIGLLRLSPAGEILDTIPSPPFPGEPATPPSTFTAAKVWDLHPDGYIVVGVSDRYAIELRKPDGTLRIEKVEERITVHPDERAEREVLREYLIRTRGQSMSAQPPPTPRTKPFLRNVYAGDDGSIWVHAHQHAVRRDPPATEPPPDAPPQMLWVEPTVFDVFDADGTYFGEVRVPSGTTLQTYAIGEVWATRTGETGELHLVRMRVSAPAESASPS